MNARLIDNFDLYTQDGWLNIKGIAALPVWAVVIVGARQVGKTYGTMDYLTSDYDHPFIYMRRTIDELELIESDDSLNPFLPMSDFGRHLNMFKSGKLWQVRDYTIDEEGKMKPGTWRGIAPPLIYFAKLRGFNGSQFTDLFYDEFIPERGVIVKRSEGDSVLNAYVTVSGNRELFGKPPLKLWLMANANDIKSPVMASLELVTEFEKLLRQNKEWSIVKRGTGSIFLAYPKSEKVIEKRKETVLMSWLSDKSRYKSMALKNEFAYNNLDLAKPKAISGMVPYLSIDDMHVYRTKDSQHYYISSLPHKKHPKFKTDDKSMYRLETEYPDIRIMYNMGLLTFESIDLLIKFQSIFKIKEK